MASDNMYETGSPFIMTGADIVRMGEPAEMLVGGKNYNTALISRVEGIRTPQFRAIPATAFHVVLDECRVNASLVYSVVDTAMAQVDWTSPAVASDHGFFGNFVRKAAAEVRERSAGTSASTCLRDFINQVVHGFAESRENIDRLRRRSMLVQAAILSSTLPAAVDAAVRKAYRDMCEEAGEGEFPVAVRSSAAGEDSRKKAFAGLQDTFLNITGEDAVAEAYLWDCASAYNLRSMTYRREAILDAIAAAEKEGKPELADAARKEWAIENTALSVCIMRMIRPVVAGTAFSADTATGCRGTSRNDLVSIDSSYGLGESIVGGMVTPDKFYVFQRDDGTDVVLRFMGRKAVRMVYNESGGGTHIEEVPADEVNQWALGENQPIEVARGVRAISKAYGGIIMDTEFCIDDKARLWFVQARPETRWNAELDEHPTTIFMRRKEVAKGAAAKAEVLLSGNGASRGAGQGTVRFLRSALELNRVHPGDILAADRTDPDMVPGMRVASAIIANVGGDTSHAAISSRELGIAAVIGVQNPLAMRAMDGQPVTVDGTRGLVYRGLLPLEEVGGEMDIAKMPATRTRVGIILADINQAMFLSRLRNVPDFEVGLLRAEFMLGSIGAHPAALEAYDNGTLEEFVERRLNELEAQVSRRVAEQIAIGQVRSPLADVQLAPYVVQLMDMASLYANASSVARAESLMGEYLQRAQMNEEVLQTSNDLRTHVRIVMGADEPGSTVTEEQVQAVMAKAASKPLVQEVLSHIGQVRNIVVARTHLSKEIEEVRSIPEKLEQLITSSGHESGRDHYIRTLGRNLALFAMSFYGKDIVYRTTDFKSNEYRNLLGGCLFEHNEDNPMLGYRGVSRDIHDWEIEAFKRARTLYGGKNLMLMLPFVRTLEQARSMRTYLANVHGLRSGEDGLKILLMSELPSNAILARQFISEFDGFSIGSNDMTQMVLATDRDNAELSHIYDEEDPAVIWAILTTIFTGQKFCKKVGFCGQGVANSRILRGMVAIAGIVSASVVPDTYIRTKHDFAEVESEHIPGSGLGAWLGEQHAEKLRALLKEHGYKKAAAIKDRTAFRGWYEVEAEKLQKDLGACLGTPFEHDARQKLFEFRRTFHKPVTYASWDWDATVFDALQQAGFASWEEQEEALRLQREKFAHA
ncbi:MAG: phosphoenolpyruvate synthase [Mailhella sp.]|nr:phosphoenolpyruvate synthase [Mailhella sp.]